MEPISRAFYVRLVVCLVEPEYSGKLGDGRLEWPPAPARIAASMFALLHEVKNHCPPAVHIDEEQVRLAEFAAEQILASPPPVILVPECRGMGVAHFVEDPTTGGERGIPARTWCFRRRVASHFERPAHPLRVQSPSSAIAWVS